jgi:hemolysin III
MTVSSDRADAVRVSADGAELEAPLGEALRTVDAEGADVEAVTHQGEWALTEYGDTDYDHPDTRPRMRGWLHLFAFFGSIVAATGMSTARGPASRWPSTA